MFCFLVPLYLVKKIVKTALTLIKHNFNNLFIILRHPGTFSENHKNKLFQNSLFFKCD